MFSIPVKISGLEKWRRSIGLLHIVAGLFLVANASSAYKVLNVSSYWMLAPIYIVPIGSIIYGLLRGKLDPDSRFNSGIRLLQAFTFLGLALSYTGAGAGAKSLGLFIWVFLSGMLSFTEKISLQKSELLFAEGGISYPNGLGRKNISWQEISDLTLRNDFVTIHYPDNRFLQFELLQPLEQEAMQNLQDFCRSQIGQTVSSS